jgi:hypothetical protein
MGNPEHVRTAEAIVERLNKEGRSVGSDIRVVSREGRRAQTASGNDAHVEGLLEKEERSSSDK